MKLPSLGALFACSGEDICHLIRRTSATCRIFDNFFSLPLPVGGLIREGSIKELPTARVAAEVPHDHNLVTDGLPALCLATDPIDPDVMTRITFNEDFTVVISFMVVG